jgi:hypothetical protein
VADDFISQINTRKMHFKSIIHHNIVTFSLKTFHTLGIRTQIFFPEADAMSTAPCHQGRFKGSKLLAPYTLAGFDLKAHNSAVSDDIIT